MRDVKYHFVSSVCCNDPALSPDVLKHWPLEREAFRPRGVRVSVHQIHSKSSWYIACIIVDMDDWKTLMWVTPIGHTLSFIITLTYHDAIQESSESSKQCCILNDMSAGENRVWPYHSIISRNACFIHWISCFFIGISSKCQNSFHPQSDTSWFPCRPRSMA